MELHKFEDYIREAVAEVPEKLRAAIKNLAFVVEEEVRPAHLAEQGVKYQGVLLGLYQGVPLTRRAGHFNVVLPDKITIFKETIERIAGPDEMAIKKLIRSVVHHEIGHYFGMNEKQVREWEKKRSR